VYVTPSGLVARRTWLILGPLGLILFTLTFALGVLPTTPTEYPKVIAIEGHKIDNVTVCAVVPKGVYVHIAKVSSVICKETPKGEKKCVAKWLKIEVVKPSEYEIPIGQLSFIKIKTCTFGKCKERVGLHTIIKPGTYDIYVSHNAPFSEELEICLRFTTISIT